jgi:hypothetical protein
VTDVTTRDCRREGGTYAHFGHRDHADRSIVITEIS